MIDERTCLPSPAAITLVIFHTLMACNHAYAEFGGRLFYIERPRLAIDLTYEMESDERQGPFSSSRNDTQTLKERFDIETGGWVYHPALMTYTLTLSPEWNQEFSEDDSERSSSSDTFLLGYSLDMNFLQNKPYSLLVFARQDYSTQTTSLATSTDTESQSYGATLLLKYNVLPTTLAIAHTSVEQSGFYEEQDTRDEARLNMRHTRPGNETEFYANYYEQQRITQGGTNNTENLFGSLWNRYRITPDNRISLFSSLNFRQSDSNQLISSGFTLSESLDWRHSENLSSYYNLIHDQEDTEYNIGTRTIERTTATAGLSHSLYENLSTSASASASTSSDGQDIYGGNLYLNYQRSIPWGMVFASIGQDYRVTKRSLGGVFVQVIDEPKTLTTGGVTLLDNDDVVLNSIVVTSADRSVVYILDLDYTVELLGTSVRISRTTFGAIAEGDTVLVSYIYLSDSAYDSSIYAQSYGIGFHLWSVWRINYRYSHAQESFLSGIPPDVLQEDTVHTFDTELNWKWSTTRLLYEDSASVSGVSTTRWRLDEMLTFRLLKGAAQLNMFGYVGHNKFKDLGSEEDFYGFRPDLSWRINNWSMARIEGIYEDVDGTSNKTIRMGASLRWEWFYGIWRGDAVYRFLNEEDLFNDQDNDRHSIFFSVRRSLF